MATVAILPVKSFAQAKQRLQHGLSQDFRESLAEAMFSDVLLALTQSTEVDEIVVVTAEERALAIAHRRGARVIQDAEQGHNEAAMLGIREALRAGAERVLLVPGDCPALDPDELDTLLTQPVQAPSILIVPDRHGTGTNALLLTPPDALAPSFGPGSCERHRANARADGIAARVVEVPSLALDIDTPDDLEVLAGRTGWAPRTHELLSRC